MLSMLLHERAYSFKVDCLSLSNCLIKSDDINLHLLHLLDQSSLLFVVRFVLIFVQNTQMQFLFLEGPAGGIYLFDVLGVYGIVQINDFPIIGLYLDLDIDGGELFVEDGSVGRFGLEGAVHKYN